jgi:hypothetical protein
VIAGFGAPEEEKVMGSDTGPLGIPLKVTLPGAEGACFRSGGAVIAAVSEMD